MSLRPKNIDFKTTFLSLECWLDKLYENQTDAVAGLDLYQTVYDLCNASPKPFVSELYDALEVFLSSKASSRAQLIINAKFPITEYIKHWKQYATATLYTNHICEYLNRLLLKVNKLGTKSTKRWSSSGKREFMHYTQLAYHIWENKALKYIQNHHDQLLTSNLMSICQRFRNGNLVELENLSIFTNSLVDIHKFSESNLEIYEAFFLTPLVTETREYYVMESAVAISEFSISDYMKKALRRVEEESLFLKKICYDESSSIAVLAACEEQYISTHKKAIIAEFESFVLSQSYTDCTNMYLLLNRIPEGITPMLSIFEDHIDSRGRNLMEVFGRSETDPKEYVDGLYSLHQLYMGWTIGVFNKDSRFVASIDKAFRKITNSTYSGINQKSAEILAKFCDLNLKKSPKSTFNEAEIEEKLSNVAVLFKYTDDKDIFQKVYAKAMAKRLVYNSSISEDIEQNMITRFIDICGAEYASKLQRMITDIKISSETLTKFKEFVNDKKTPLGMDFGILVLTSGSWPFPNLATPHPTPYQFERCIDMFEKYYVSQHSGRKLTWLHYLSRVDVKSSNFDKRYEFSMSSAQLNIISQFNHETSIGTAELMKNLSMTEIDLKKNIKGFIDIGLLKYAKDTLNEQSIFQLNHNFTSKKVKIKIVAAPTSETSETETVSKSIEEDRRLYLQATMVRIMKSRKELEHVNLISEVISQTKSRFNPSVPMIKKCIEYLIEKQYLERHPESKDKYVYVS